MRESYKRKQNNKTINNKQIRVMITIKKNMCDFYEVKIWGAGCVVLQEKFEHAIDLCRLRLGTTLQENKITVIKVPFVNLWLVW